MRTLSIVCGLLIGLSSLSQLAAGQFNDVLSIGDAGPAWVDLPGVDEKKHSLADLKDKPLVLVVFTCNSCPVSNDYEDRINAFAKKHASEVAVVAINVNTVAADRMPQMQERAKEKKYVFPYLHDESQKIGKAYGAAFTPEFFLLNKERKVVFMGGMDDNSDADIVKHHYLEDAVQAALKGEKPATAETVSIGCRVRYVSERRKKS
ncbi:MAG: thioredoxin family protein [Planctomycetota bacterium]